MPYFNIVAQANENTVVTEYEPVFNSEEAAEEYALYLSSCSDAGAEILHLSNPGDYDFVKVSLCLFIRTFRNL